MGPAGAVQPTAGRSVGSLLAQAATAYDAQVVLIRRPGDHRPPGVRRWFVVDHASGTVVAGEWTEADDLGAAAEALASGAEHPTRDRSDVPTLFSYAHMENVTCAAPSWPDRSSRTWRPAGRTACGRAAIWAGTGSPRPPHAARACSTDASTPRSPRGWWERHLAGDVDPAYLRG